MKCDVNSYENSELCHQGITRGTAEQLGEGTRQIFSSFIVQNDAGEDGRAMFVKVVWWFWA